MDVGRASERSPQLFVSQQDSVSTVYFANVRI